MNIVMDEAAEVFVKDAKPRRELGRWSGCIDFISANNSTGRILLKGDNITLIQQAS